MLRVWFGVCAVLVTEKVPGSTDSLQERRGENFFLCGVKLQALVYDILPLEEGAGKRCAECDAGSTFCAGTLRASLSGTFLIEGRMS